MVRITVELLRKRAEHNDGVLSSLQEVGLHQQGIEKIELLGHLCKHLRILYLQGNVICKLENLHRLKELRHLNMALNNITKVQNLQKLESLQKLDLTANFIDAAALPSLRSLQFNGLLRELHLLGNPCTKWPSYRPFMVASVPQLQSLDGKAITASERIAARQALPDLAHQLRAHLSAQGVDIDAVSAVEDDSLADMEEIPETGHMNEAGEMIRPWCPATRILDQREIEQENAASEAAKRAGMQSRKPEGSYGQPPPRRDDFPPLAEDGERVRQCNEGKWDFEIRESTDNVMLEVNVGPGIDTSLIKADVQPLLIRLLIKGRLLQLELPQEVRPDASSAQRSLASSKLLVTMPLLTSASGPIADRQNSRSDGKGMPLVNVGVQTGRAKAKVITADLDDDLVPEL